MVHATFFLFLCHCWIVFVAPQILPSSLSSWIALGPTDLVTKFQIYNNTESVFNGGVFMLIRDTAAASTSSLQLKFWNDTAKALQLAATESDILDFLFIPNDPVIIAFLKNRTLHAPLTGEFAQSSLLNFTYVPNNVTATTTFMVQFPLPFTEDARKSNLIFYYSKAAANLTFFDFDRNFDPVYQIGDELMSTSLSLDLCSFAIADQFVYAFSCSSNFFYVYYLFPQTPTITSNLTLFTPRLTTVTTCGGFGSAIPDLRAGLMYVTCPKSNKIICIYLNNPSVSYDCVQSTPANVVKLDTPSYLMNQDNVTLLVGMTGGIFKLTRTAVPTRTEVDRVEQFCGGGKDTSSGVTVPSLPCKNSMVQFSDNILLIAYAPEINLYAIGMSPDAPAPTTASPTTASPATSLTSSTPYFSIISQNERYESKKFFIQTPQKKLTSMGPNAVFTITATSTVLYVCSPKQHVLFKYFYGLSSTTIFGTLDSPGSYLPVPTSALPPKVDPFSGVTFNGPQGIAVWGRVRPTYNNESLSKVKEGIAFRLYIADSENKAIRRTTHESLTNDKNTLIWGHMLTNTANKDNNKPFGLTIYRSILFITFGNNNYIGWMKAVSGSMVLMNGDLLKQPVGGYYEIAVDCQRKRIYIVDDVRGSVSEIRMFSPKQLNRIIGGDDAKAAAWGAVTEGIEFMVGARGAGRALAVIGNHLHFTTSSGKIIYRYGLPESRESCSCKYSASETPSETATYTKKTPTRQRKSKSVTPSLSLSDSFSLSNSDSPTVSEVNASNSLSKSQSFMYSPNKTVSEGETQVTASETFAQTTLPILLPPPPETSQVAYVMGQIQMYLTLINQIMLSPYTPFLYQQTRIIDTAECEGTRGADVVSNWFRVPIGDGWLSTYKGGVVVNLSLIGSGLLLFCLFDYWNFKIRFVPMTSPGYGLAPLVTFHMPMWWCSFRLIMNSKGNLQALFLGLFGGFIQGAFTIFTANTLRQYSHNARLHVLWGGIQPHKTLHPFWELLLQGLFSILVSFYSKDKDENYCSVVQGFAVSLQAVHLGYVFFFRPHMIPFDRYLNLTVDGLNVFVGILSLFRRADFNAHLAALVLYIIISIVLTLLRLPDFIQNILLFFKTYGHAFMFWLFRSGDVPSVGDLVTMEDKLLDITEKRIQAIEEMNSRVPLESERMLSQQLLHSDSPQKAAQDEKRFMRFVPEETAPKESFITIPHSPLWKSPPQQRERSERSPTSSYTSQRAHPPPPRSWSTEVVVPIQGAVINLPQQIEKDLPPRNQNHRSTISVEPTITEQPSVSKANALKSAIAQYSTKPSPSPGYGNSSLL